MADELTDMEQQLELGWNADNARAIVARSLTLLDALTTETETYLTQWMQERDERLVQAWETFTELAKEWREYCTQANKELGPAKYGIMRKYYAQANTLIDVGRDLESLLGKTPRTMVSLAKDVLIIVEKVVRLQRDVAVMFAAPEEKATGGADELADWLTPEQMVQVMTWMRENREV